MTAELISATRRLETCATCPQITLPSDSDP